jgi:hypothetical protein
MPLVEQELLTLPEHPGYLQDEPAPLVTFVVMVTQIFSKGK